MPLMIINSAVIVGSLILHLASHVVLSTPKPLILKSNISKIINNYLDVIVQVGDLQNCAWVMWS